SWCSAGRRAARARTSSRSRPSWRRARARRSRRSRSRPRATARRTSAAARARAAASPRRIASACGAFHRSEAARASMQVTVEEVRAGLRAARYVTTGRVETALFLALVLEKPLLAEGPAGAGKTELGKVLASMLGTELVRLQCYEGLDEARALYEWNYQKQ